MKLRKQHLFGALAAFLIVVISVALYWVEISQAFTLFIEEGESFFVGIPEILLFLFSIAIFVGGLPFLVSLISEDKKEIESSEMFLEFSRDLVESVGSGTPVSKSVAILKNRDYGVLSPSVKKLSNQISLGISVKEALEIFAKDVGTKSVEKAVSLIREAEKAGGEIEKILESVAESVQETEKIKKERRKSVHSLIVQGYIIFFIFIAIMLIMQFYIIPMTSEFAMGEAVDGGALGFGGGEGEALTAEQFAIPLLGLLVIQGFFIGLVIGKLSEGKVKAGMKHSFILIMIAILIYTGTRTFI